MKAKALYIISLFLITLQLAEAQRPFNEITVDLNAQEFKQALDFDIDQIIKGGIPKEIHQVTLNILFSGPGRIPAFGQYIWNKNLSIKDDNNFSFRINPLDANTDYVFEFTLLRKLSDNEKKAHRLKIINTLDNFTRTDPSIVAYTSGGTSVLPIGSLGSLRARLRSELPTLPAGQSYQFPASGLFSSIGPPTASEWSSFLSSQVNLETERGNITSSIHTLDGYLSTLNTKSRIIKKMQNYFLNGPSNRKNWSYKSLGEQLLEINAFSTLSGHTRSNLSQGIISINDDLELALNSKLGLSISDVWNKDEVLVRINNYKLLLEYLTKHHTFLKNAKAFKEANRKVKSFSLSDIFNLTNDFQNAIDEVIRLVDLHNDVISVLAERESTFKKQANKIEFQANTEVSVESTTTISNIRIRSGLHTSMDFGIAFLPVKTNNQIPVEVEPYYGVNIYLSPINKSVPLRNFNSRERMIRSFSFVAGMTLLDFKKEGERKGLIRNVGIITGVGYRITNVVKIGGGVVWFQQDDPSPLIEDYDLSATSYLSISLDINAFQSLGKLSSTILGF